MAGMRPVRGIHTSEHAFFWYANKSWENLIARSAVFSSQIFYYFTAFVLTQIIEET
jgi:hypothetical protein